jgi:hypothetical protein
VDIGASQDALPTLYRDRSFWGMAATQFLGAFNDNLFKQLILLLATPTAVEAAANLAKDRQAEAQLIFASAFLIFSGFAGYVSDRFRRSQRIIRRPVPDGRPQRVLWAGKVRNPAGNDPPLRFAARQRPVPDAHVSGDHLRDRSGRRVAGVFRQSRVARLAGVHGNRLGR